MQSKPLAFEIAASESVPRFDYRTNLSMAVVIPFATLVLVSLVFSSGFSPVIALAFGVLAPTISLLITFRHFTGGPREGRALSVIALIIDLIQLLVIACVLLRIAGP